MTVTRFGHVGLTVANLERSKAFYSDLFGFEEFFRVTRAQKWVEAQTGYPGAKIEYLHMRTAGVHIELLGYILPCSTLPVSPDTFYPGHCHFSLFVNDLEAMTMQIADYLKAMPEPGLARFAARPFDLAATTITEGPQTGGRGYYLRDPDGHTIELWEPAPAGIEFGR